MTDYLVYIWDKNKDMSVESSQVNILWKAFKCRLHNNAVFHWCLQNDRWCVKQRIRRQMTKLRLYKQVLFYDLFILWVDAFCSKTIIYNVHILKIGFFFSIRVEKLYIFKPIVLRKKGRLGRDFTLFNGTSVYSWETGVWVMLVLLILS